MPREHRFGLFDSATVIGLGCILMIMSAHVGAAWSKPTALRLGGSADADGDGDVDLDDYRAWPPCHVGPGGGVLPGICALLDFANDQDVDLDDFEEFQRLFIPPPPAAGDRCGLAIPIFGEDVFPFNNVTATRDGPDHVACAASGTGQINNDLWMCWNAPCSGMVVVDSCDLTTIDSKIAVYSGCSCPVTDQRLLACNDDEFFCGVQARTTFDAVASMNYLIRVGSYPGSTGGSGSIRISCGFDACPNPAGECFTAHGGLGCSNETCCNMLCAVDPVCCEVEFDDFCADEAGGICDGGFDVCGSPLTEDCRTLSDAPGCNQASCCDAVCAVDPSCCLLAWDQICVEDLEPAICFGACEPGAGSCFSAHGHAGCENQACCAQVCPRDPFCCRNEWDAGCTALAQFYCH